MQQIIVRAFDVNRAEITLCDSGKIIDHFNGFIGKNGLTNNKIEGDNKTPIGTFAINRIFGFAPIKSKMPIIKITDKDVWVDDPESEFYNTLQKRGGNWKSAENMKIPFYEYGAIIEYNTENPVPGAGSAMFLHIKEEPTAGCVAVPRDKMIFINEWLNPAKKPTIKIDAL